MYKSCCLLGVEKSCTDLTKVILSSGVQRVDFEVYKNQDKENLKRVAWGLDVGHEDRTRIKSLMFAFAYFLRFILYIFLFMQVFYLKANYLCFSVCAAIVCRSYKYNNESLAGIKINPDKYDLPEGYSPLLGSDTHSIALNVVHSLEKWYHL